MYVRFFRWASDRLPNEGVLAFVCNNGFLDSLAFDGFRKTIQKEFTEAWVVDLKGNARSSGEFRRRQGGNVFDDKIKVGICVAIFVRKAALSTFTLHYCAVPDYAKGSEKRTFIDTHELGPHFRVFRPGPDGVWLNPGEAGWDAMLPVGDPEVGAGDVEGGVDAIFRLSSNGVKTQRDDWMWATDKRALVRKAALLIREYESVRAKTKAVQDSTVKWDAELDRHLENNIQIRLRRDQIRLAQFRPFVRRWLYLDSYLNGRVYRQSFLFRESKPNPAIAFLGIASSAPFAVLGTDRVFDLGLVKCGNGGTQGVARYRYTKSGERVDNITDWAVEQFRGHYGPLADGSAIGKDDIFAYVYAALHDPVWRSTYAADLRRSFPRIPFHDDFLRWRDWGQRLLDLHIGYEAVAPHGDVTRVDTPSPGSPAASPTSPARGEVEAGEVKEGGGKAVAPKVVLKSDPDNGKVILDSVTQLTGIPRVAWDYRLGSRSAIDWVLDQHKEKTPRDPTVAAKFNTYRFAAHKERVIDLLGRVVTVSVETVAIVEAMRAEAAREMPDSAVA